MSWAMREAETGGIGPVDPAALASYWRERQSVAEALAPLPIEREKLKPLLSKEEQLLIHLNETQLAKEVQQRIETEAPE